MADTFELEIVIIGAGATGLLVAQGLKLVRVVHKQSLRFTETTEQHADMNSTLRMVSKPQCSKERMSPHILLGLENGE